MNKNGEESRKKSNELSPEFEYFLGIYYEVLDDWGKKLPDFTETEEELFLRRFALELQIAQIKDYLDDGIIWIDIQVLQRKIRKFTDKNKYRKWRSVYLRKMKRRFDCDWVVISYRTADKPQKVTVLRSEAEYALGNLESYSPLKPRKATRYEIQNMMIRTQRIRTED